MLSCRFPLFLSCCQCILLVYQIVFSCCWFRLSSPVGWFLLLCFLSVFFVLCYRVVFRCCLLRLFSLVAFSYCFLLLFYSVVPYCFLGVCFFFVSSCNFFLSCSIVDFSCVVLLLFPLVGLSVVVLFSLVVLYCCFLVVCCLVVISNELFCCYVLLRLVEYLM